MTRARVSQRFIMSALLSLFFSPIAVAQWDLDTVHVAGGDCVVRQRQTDESKLTIYFDDFRLGIPGVNATAIHAKEGCAMRVDFTVPPQHRLKLLTHRIFSHASKDKRSELNLKTTVVLVDAVFKQEGRLRKGVEFNGHLLLYKSYNVQNAVSCEPFEQRVALTAEWDLEIEADAGAMATFADLSGPHDSIDMWLDLEKC